MISLIHAYVLAFLHPFKNQQGLRQLREHADEVSGLRHLRLAGEVSSEDMPALYEVEEVATLKFEEVLGVSWLFVAVEGFYAILALHLGQVFFQSWSSPEELALLLPIDTSLYTQKAMLSAALAKVAFFPIVFWFYTKLWKVLIQFFAGLFQVEGNVAKMAQQVVNQSMTSHMMLAIPIFGKMLRHLSALVHLFAGLRENMQMSVLQSAVVILSPAVIMTMISSFFMVTVLYLVSLTL